MSPPHLSLIIVPNDIAASWGHGTGLQKHANEHSVVPLHYIIVLCIHLCYYIFGPQVFHSGDECCRMRPGHHTRVWVIHICTHLKAYDVTRTASEHTG